MYSLKSTSYTHTSLIPNVILSLISYGYKMLLSDLHSTYVQKYQPVFEDLKDFFLILHSLENSRDIVRILLS